MNFLTRRRYRKFVRQLLHEARHARNMREDIADPEFLAALDKAKEELVEAWKSRQLDLVDKKAEALRDAAARVYPPKKQAGLRENIEIFAVAIAVAMAFRSYFIQPFKIPTGSMQPTLYGITVDGEAEKSLMDRFPFSIAQFLLFGESYKEVTAKADGIAERVGRGEGTELFRIGGKLHEIRHGMRIYFQPNRSQVKQGDLLASGRKKLGDHIFVNRIWYNFTGPERGDVFVFSTSDIEYPEIRPDSFYIKRLVGLPNERVEIDPPNLVVDGDIVQEPYPFYRLTHDFDAGYRGYVLPEAASTHQRTRMNDRHPYIELGDREYLPFGDNTQASLDGRFFGAVPEHSIVGPAFWVYWPFTRRWGHIR